MIENDENLPLESPKSFRVVAALIRKDGRVLLTQRWPARHLGLTWEFPGGKVEPGESDAEALARELQEELGVDAVIGSCCFETKHGYGNREVHLLIFRCKLLGVPQAMDVKALEWVDESSLHTRNFPPADLLFVNELVAGHIALDDVDEDEGEIEFKPPQVLRRVNIAAGISGEEEK